MVLCGISRKKIVQKKRELWDEYLIEKHFVLIECDQTLTVIMLLMCLQYFLIPKAYGVSYKDKTPLK